MQQSSAPFLCSKKYINIERFIVLSLGLCYNIGVYVFLIIKIFLVGSVRVKKLFNKLFIEETNNTMIQFFRSVFVGGVASVADIAVLALFKELFGMSEVISTILGFIAGLTVNYVISTYWVFAKAKVKNRVFDFIAFGVIGIIGLGLTELIIAPFASDGIFGVGYFVSNATFGTLIPVDKYYLVGKLIAIVLVYIWNFCARKFILYRNCEEK